MATITQIMEAERRAAFDETRPTVTAEALAAALKKIEAARPCPLPIGISPRGLPRPGRARTMVYAEGFVMVRNTGAVPFVIDLKMLRATLEELSTDPDPPSE